MAEVIKKKLTPVQEQMVETGKTIKQFSLACEANIVSCLWKEPELFFTYDSLSLNSFTNNIWKVFWQIGYDIIVSENKRVLDEVTVGLYLEKHKKLSDKYHEYGGFEKISKATEYVDLKNIDGYTDELNKWKVAMDLLKQGFPVQDRLKDFVDMDISAIYDEYEAIVNHVFVGADTNDKAVDIADGIDELIDKLNEGIAIGLPYDALPITTKETGGMLLGNVTMIGGLSGVGKTTFVRNSVIPTIIKNNEKLLILINEEDATKWQREFLVWVSNNIYGEEVHKYQVRDGNYPPEFMQILKRSAQWIKDHSGIIKILSLSSFTTSKAIKHIKKYAHLGFSYFVLDTFKADSDNGKSDNQTWLQMQQNMVKIYDVVKPKGKNVHLIVTFQLSKSSSIQRFYTQDNIGMAKNMVDVASTCIMIRPAFDDEYEDGKKELDCMRLKEERRKEKKNIDGKEVEEEKIVIKKIPFKLQNNKKYQILFIVKNREGATNDKQIVLEHDLSTNILIEAGICHVPVDF